MSIRIMTKVFSAKVGSAIRKLILLKLADNADDSGRCWPSQSYLMDVCEISERTLRDHLRKLEEDGFITATPKYENGVRVGTDYHINVDALHEPAPARQNLPVDEDYRQISPSLPAEFAGTYRQNLPFTTGRICRQTVIGNRHIEPSYPPPVSPPKGGSAAKAAKLMLMLMRISTF